MNIKKHITIFFLFISLIAFSQEKEFTVKVRVVDESNNNSIKNAETSVNGRIFMFSEINEEYLITAKVGDELIVRHPDFETVYYTILSDEEIKVLVKGFTQTIRKKLKYKSKEKVVDTFHQNLDSAKFYKLQHYAL